mgnify:FL=1
MHRLRETGLLKKRKYIYIGLLAILILTAVLNIKTFSELKLSKERALQNSLEMTEVRSTYLSEYFEQAEYHLSSLRNVLLNLVKADKFDRELMNQMIRTSLNTKNEILSIWVYLEPDAFDRDALNKSTIGSQEEGRYAPWFYYNQEKSSVIENVCGTDQYDFYLYPKKLNREVLLEPYKTTNAGDAHYITLTQPIVYNGFKGSMGIDWVWSEFSHVVTERPLIKRDVSYLISEQGHILSHWDEDMLGNKVDSLILDQLAVVKRGEKVVQQIPGKDFYRVITNFKVPYTESKWYLVREIPMSADFFTIITQNQNTWRIGLLIFVLLIILIYCLTHLIDYVMADREKLKLELTGSIDATTDGICVVSSDYTYSQINQSYKIWIKYLMGVDAAEGDDVFDQLSADNVAWIKDNLEQAFAGKFFIDEQIYSGRRYRHYFNPIINDEREVHSVAVRLTDVTDQLKNEEELKNYRQNLEELIGERTAELREMVVKVKEARLKLVESEKNATLGLLSSGLSDELSNPVNFVIGNVTPLRKDVNELCHLVQLLQRTDHEDEATQLKEALDYLRQVDADVLIPEINTLLDGIERGASRISEIVMNFNEFVRPDKQARFENINRSIELAIEFLTPKIPAEIELIEELSEDLPSTFCDIGKINDAFLTIIDHAIRLTTKGELHLRSECDNTGWISVSIFGKNLTITGEERANLLDSYDHPGEGVSNNGIGLALCQKVLEAHGGTLEIVSVKDRPTNGFMIKIPVLLKSAYTVIEGNQHH